MGHSHPGITEVIVKQAARGTAYAAPDESQIALADALTRRVGSVDLVRFCNSGTEAVMNACAGCARLHEPLQDSQNGGWFSRNT